MYSNNPTKFTENLQIYIYIYVMGYIDNPKMAITKTLYKYIDNKDYVKQEKELSNQITD
jgi:hypothetical protein